MKMSGSLPLQVVDGGMFFRLSYTSESEHVREIVLTSILYPAY